MRLRLVVAFMAIVACSFLVIVESGDSDLSLNKDERASRHRHHHKHKHKHHDKDVDFGPSAGELQGFVAGLALLKVKAVASVIITAMLALFLVKLVGHKLICDGGPCLFPSYPTPIVQLEEPYHFPNKTYNYPDPRIPDGTPLEHYH